MPKGHNGITEDSARFEILKDTCMFSLHQRSVSFILKVTTFAGMQNSERVPRDTGYKSDIALCGSKCLGLRLYINRGGTRWMSIGCFRTVSITMSGRGERGYIHSVLYPYSHAAVREAFQR